MKKIFKHIGLIALAILVGIGSIFVPLNKKENQIYSASANTNPTIPTLPDLPSGNFDISFSDLSFKGSDIYLPVLRNGSDAIYDYLLLRINFSLNNVNELLTYSFTGSTGFFVQNQYNYNGTTFNFNVISYVQPVSSGASPVVSFSSIFNSDTIYSANIYYGVKSADNTCSMYLVGSEKPLSSDIIACSIGSSSTVVGLSGSYNFIRYTDADSNYIIFYFPCIETRCLLENRNYYFNTDLTDNQVYNQGYQQGLADNQQPIYDKGYQAGKTVGYGQGKNDGIASANNYSFLGLIGAVIDAPIKAFTGLFNFEFMGVNMLGFFTGLLTFMLIIFVIKLFIGGK